MCHKKRANGIFMTLLSEALFHYKALWRVSESSQSVVWCKRYNYYFTATLADSPGIF